MSIKSSAALTLRQSQSEADSIRESIVPGAPRIAIKLLACILVLAVALTFIVPVDRVVTSESGKVVPTQAINVFQALDASIIKSIDVKEGQIVKKGDLLATLDQTFAAADVSQLRLQLAGLDAQITRAEAELGERIPAFDKLTDPDRARYATIQQALFQQRTAQYKAQIASFEDKIRQTQATIAKYRNEENRYGERAKISQQIESMRATLAERQTGSLLNLYNSQDQHLEMLRYAEMQHNSLIEAQHQIAALEKDKEAFKQQWAAQLSGDLVIARNTRDQVRAALSKATRKQELVVWRAQEDGVILTIAKLSVGSILKEGDQLITMMPSRTPVEAELHILSRDIGFLRVNDSTTLKVDAFNSAEHGSAEGRVAWISDSTFQTEDDGRSSDHPYYKVRVSIKSFHFRGVPNNFRLIPGMTLVADINVGSRSLARYIFGGALRSAGEAMREP